MKTGRKFYVYLSLAIAETIFLVWFSFFPSVSVVPQENFLRPGDSEHFAAYAVYGFLWSGIFIFRIRMKKLRNRLLLTIAAPPLIGSLVGGACEAIQFFVPTRTADMLDWAFDALGSLVGAAMASKMKTL